MRHWKKLKKSEIRKRVFDALAENTDFAEKETLGVPASHLDDKVFYQDAPFLGDAPFLTTLIKNPNHIGCHTLGASESFFRGTQDIERELIALCAEDILRAPANSCDGYVSSGGTEANMQAIWIYRNYFLRRRGARHREIAVLCSADFHYSMSKAADVFGIRHAAVPVDGDTRTVSEADIAATVAELKSAGVKYFIVVVNMMTTMFGSVDDPDTYVRAMEASESEFKMHADGAYGGFIYPFTNARNALDFSNPHITSVTLDAHKMVQAPYGTGVFIVRKGWMQYANTKEASYVEGEDYTLIGSRSGANAVAVWMILMTYGRYGWEEKIAVLMKRTDWLCKQLDGAGVSYFRNPYANIVTVRAVHVPEQTARRFGLVPDAHGNPAFYKIVVMDHVTIEKLIPLTEALKAARKITT